MEGGPGLELVSGGKKQTGDERPKTGEKTKVFGFQFSVNILFKLLQKI
jgi:hypothetical protein